jgi:hypothetical protein
LAQLGWRQFLVFSIWSIIAILSAPDKVISNIFQGEFTLQNRVAFLNEAKELSKLHLIKGLSRINRNLFEESRPTHAATLILNSSNTLTASPIQVIGNEIMCLDDREGTILY